MPARHPKLYSSALDRVFRFRCLEGTGAETHLMYVISGLEVVLSDERLESELG